ncbi:MAG: DUF3604 domain-containing protein [Pseudomonadales bacterium]
MPADVMVVDAEIAANRSAYFGDLHVHTTYSFDAFAFGTLATPYDAYRYARGETLRHPAGFDMKLQRPLDFYAVTDHAMFLGAVRAAADTSTKFSTLPHTDYLHGLNLPENLTPGGTPERSKAFSTFLVETLDGILAGNIDVDEVYDIARDAWTDTIRAAEEFNDPGKFTTLVAYEYTSSTDDRGNLHRNVFFRNADNLPAMPFSRFHDQNPEGLWDWMDELREQGIESLAIPHNSNGSNGQMFKLVDWAGDPIDDEYAGQRIRNEPLVEITQAKGTSETHPVLSDNDEWAGFEIMPFRVATTLESEPSGSYVREALLNGLVLQDREVSNPYRFGFIGSSDTHTGATAIDESDFYGKIGLLDANGELTGSLPMPDEAAQRAIEAGSTNIKEIDGRYYRDVAQITWGASGLAAVWAQENTRGAVYDALRRKETFATSGPRIKVRLFGGYDFDQDMLGKRDVVTRAYREGVPMGSNLLAKSDNTPTFIAWAMQDAQSAPLQRLQIIKGWTVSGEHHEMVYDVACSEGSPDPSTHRCPDNGAKVDPSDCSITMGVGAPEIKTVWTDPDFDPAHRAFYYIRALENPTCRWSTWDAVRTGVEPRPDIPATIQERAWSSPIWFVPKG